MHVYITLELYAHYCDHRTQHIVPATSIYYERHLSEEKTFFYTFPEIITNSQNANFEIKIKSCLGTKPIKSAIIRCVSTISHNATENNTLQFLRFSACSSITFPISLKLNQIPPNPLMIKLIQWQILGNKELSWLFISKSNWQRL